MILWIKPIILFFISFVSMMHPVHVSITSMEYDQSKNEIFVSFKVFKDDFRLLFAHLYQLNLDFSESGNNTVYQEKIDQYFIDHFIVKEEEKIWKLVNDGMKMNDESIWFNYKIEEVNSIHSIKIVNTIFMDLFMDQKNLMIVKSGDQEKGYRFDYKTREYLIELK